MRDFVYKYACDAYYREGDRFELLMPAGAEVLSADYDSGAFYVWARVDPFAHTVVRHVHIAPTGSRIEPFLMREPVFINRIDIKGMETTLRFHAFDFGETPDLVKS